MALGEAIEELRKEAGLSHEQLADRLGVHPSRVGQYERGRENPTFSTLLRLADALGIKFSELGKRMEKIHESARR